jgi:hypothetical protein
MAHGSKLQEVVDETSALGHKRTWDDQIAMSALPPKADIRCDSRNVRSGQTRTWPLA